ncbi:MAG: arylsulfatase [Roseibacillus sp.]|nr:arylsulfatase [Roseibacillus sp.]
MKPTNVPFLFAILLALALSGQATERPNIVLIMADDLGFSDLGCYGAEIRTPHLDQLARDGLRFSQFYNTAKCHSSRVSLLTGLYCDQAGSNSLSRGTTIAEVLRTAGYSTAMSGKWHLSGNPVEFGFQHYWGHLSGATNFFTGDDTFRHGAEKWKVPTKLNGQPFYVTDAITDFAINFIDEMIPGKTEGASENPFLLYVAYNAPHYPLQAPEKEIAKYKGAYDAGWDELRRQRYLKQMKTGLFPRKFELSQRPSHVPSWDSLSAEDRKWEARRMEVFAAMVDVVDQNVGRLVAHLKKRGAWENTLFLFCSDNGACPFDRTRGKDLQPWDPKSYWCYDVGWAHVGNTPFRLYKQNQHEGGISSPLIAHWPRGLKAEPGRSAAGVDQGLSPTPLGPITRQPGHLIDFMATFLELGKASYPKKVGSRTIDPLQGKSLAPIFQGKQREGHPTLYQHFGTDRALRQGDWKVVAAKGGRWELYNMAEDRTELNDLRKKQPERATRMIAEWFRIAREVDRLKPGQLKPGTGRLSPLRFGKRNDPGEGGAPPKKKGSRKKKQPKSPSAS